MRREMQSIIEGVYLGPYFCARDRDLLQRTGITHILCVRDPRESAIVRAYFPQEFTYLELEVEDENERNLIPLFPAAVRFIREALAQGGRVLVHCNTGIYRSPAFVVTYLMEEVGMPFLVAFQFVQNQRFCVNPNDGYRSALRVCTGVPCVGVGWGWGSRTHRFLGRNTNRSSGRNNNPYPVHILHGGDV